MATDSETIDIELDEEEIYEIISNLESATGSDQSIEDAYSNLQFRVVYQSNNFFLPQLQALIKGKEVLNLRPEYQRRLKWSNKKKSQLIESLLLNIPIPPIYLYESEAARYEVMDGQQRLNAVFDFMENNFGLIGMEKLSFLNGRRFNRLPPKVRRGLERASISAIVLLQETRSEKSDPYVVRRYVFERLNTGGEPLNRQEIRNSLYRGPFNDLIVRLARNHIFCNIFDIPSYSAVDESEYYENPERQRNKLYRSMGDCQLILRFFALQNDADIRGSMSTILDRCMENNLDASDADIQAKTRQFDAVITASSMIFGKDAFKLPASSRGERRPSAAIFDAVGVAMARRFEKIPLYLQRSEAVRDRVEELIRNETQLMTAKANTANSIKQRIAAAGAALDAGL